MKIEVEIIEINIDLAICFDVNQYPNSGIYLLSHDPLNYYAVSKQYSSVNIVFIESFGVIDNIKDEPKVVDTSPKESTVTVDEMIRVIAVSKDARHIKEVLK